MHTASKVVIGLGIVILLIGVILIFIGDSFEENVTDGIIYEDADGQITIEAVAENEGSRYIVHLINVKYVGGGTGGYNEAHGNNTWNLTTDDCDLVKSFSLNSEGNEMFYPECNYIQDDTVDEYIVIGRLCTTPIYGEEGWEIGHDGEGCRAGTYTWDTAGVNVMVYDIAALFDAIGAWFGKWMGIFGACCCGSIILIIGIIMAATMEDNNTNPYVQQTTTNTEQTPQASSAWDEQEDYIHRQKEDEEVPEKSDIAIPESEEKERRGEYKIPPSE